MKLACVDLIAPGISLEEKMSYLAKYGFEGIEIWLMEEEDLDAKAKEINEAAESYKIKPSAVVISGPASVSPLDSEENIEARKKLIKDSLYLASKIGSITFAAMMEEPRSIVPIFEKDKPSDYEKKLLIDFLRDVGRYADDVGATLALEPVNRYETHFFNTLAEAVEICREVGCENIKVMADTCEMNFEEKDISKAIEDAQDYLCYVHLSENNRLLPGYGHIDFRQIFSILKKIGYNGYMSLECAVPENKPEEELPKCVEYLKKCME